MNTKERILDAAHTLFSQHGYANVFVAQIAQAVGIKAPSLYKHFKSKQEIFDTILLERKDSYDRQAASLGLNGSDARIDSKRFSAVSEDELVELGTSLFGFFLHDDHAQKFRKMLTIEQFHSAELAQYYSSQYADAPLVYQASLFAFLCAKGVLVRHDPTVMALQFYSPRRLIKRLIVLQKSCPPTTNPRWVSRPRWCLP